MSELLKLLNNISPWHCAVMDIKLRYTNNISVFEIYKFIYRGGTDSRIHWNSVYTETIL